MVPPLLATIFRSRMSSLAIAVSLAPVGKPACDPEKVGIHRWLSDGGRAGFLAVCPLDGGEARVYDLAADGARASASRLLAGEEAASFVSWNPVRDQALLAAAGLGGACGAKPWFGLWSRAKMLRLPEKDGATMAHAVGVGDGEDTWRALLNPPAGLMGGEGRAGARRVAQDTAAVMATLLAHDMTCERFETKVEQMTYAMCERGVGVDLHLVRIMRDARDHILDEIVRRFVATTGFKPSQRDKFEGWLGEWGILVPSLEAQFHAPILEAILGIDGDADRALVLDMWDIYLDATRSSLKKLDTMDEHADNGRLKGHIDYHGAHTGRWTARGVQLHNFPRSGERAGEAVEALLDAGRNPAKAAEALRTCAKRVGKLPLAYLTTLMRGALTDDAGLASLDLAQIEARDLAHVAGEEEMLATFISSNNGGAGDIYKIFTGRVFGKPEGEVSLAERNSIGKPVILGSGFGLSPKGAALRFTSIAPELAERAVREYRAAYPRIVALWRELASGATLALRGEQVSVGLGGGCAAEFEDVLIAPGVHRIVMRVSVGALVSRQYYDPEFAESWKAGHKLTENLVQRVARDCMAAAMISLWGQGEVPLHSNHDEPIFARTATLEARIPPALAKVEAGLCLPPGTLAFEYREGSRYGK